MQELVTIQTSLNAPKDKKNTFANYVYRSAESILEALKPLLKETNCTVVLTDELVLIGDRYYIKATATLSNKAGEKMSACGFAREAEIKKGNDDAQITGACSSYARKYALCGLFAIDDSRADPDNDDNSKRGTAEDPSKRTRATAPAKPAPATPAPAAKAKPLVQDGNELWAKAIEYCVSKNAAPESLRKYYTISDADLVKLSEIVAFQRSFHNPEN